MVRIDFMVPFSGFAATTFMNCFASVYMYLEGMGRPDGNVTYCSRWENGQCNSCGNCVTKPNAVQERVFFLFDTICGHSALRCRFDGKVTKMEEMINATDFYDGSSSDNIEFLFGFAGYGYRMVTEADAFRDEIIASLGGNRPVIAKLKDNSVPFAVISGLDGEEIICPDYRCAQKSPDPAVAFGGIEALYIVSDKTVPKYSLVDGLKRIEQVMDFCLEEDLWGGYLKKMGTYGPDSLGGDAPGGRKVRMKRLAETMWHTFNSHNFAEVFRVYLPDSKCRSVYDGINDVSGLGGAEIGEFVHTVNWRYGYTHDLAWSLIGLEECIDWNDWKSHYYGDMIGVVIEKLKENDRAVLECVRQMIRVLENQGSKTV